MSKSGELNCSHACSYPLKESIKVGTVNIEHCYVHLQQEQVTGSHSASVHLMYGLKCMGTLIAMKPKV